MAKLALSLLVGACATFGAFADTLMVTSLNDEFPAATPGTFRYELEHSSAGDTIVFDDSIAGGTITMVGVADVTPQQDTSFVIAHALTIEGNGVTINGGWNGVPASLTGTRIFLTTADQGKTTIKNLNLVNGHGANVWDSTEEKFYLGGAINAGSPIRLENCRLANNCTLDKQYTSYAYPDNPGGGAIRADSDLELVSCDFVKNSIPNPTGGRGGAICQLGGSLTVEDTVFDHDYTKTYGGGAVYLASGVTGATFTNCKFIENSNGGGEGLNGAVIWCQMSSGALKLFGCAVRGGSSKDQQGGAIWYANNVELTAVDCEFSDCNSRWGGVLYTNGNKQPLFVNCTFRGNTASDWGGAMEIIGKVYFVNCTVVGSYCYSANQGGALYASSGAGLLNTVVAYNYYGASGAANSDGYIDGGERLCSLCSGGSSVPGLNSYTLAKTLDEVPTATKLFADYEMVSERHGDSQDTRAALPASVVMPKLSDDTYSTRVVEIGEDSVLKSGGYKVRANADYSYIEYSDNGGTSWTKFFSRDGASKDNLTEITADQRGIPYEDGMIPIGAATVTHTPAVDVLPQGVIVK